MAAILSASLGGPPLAGICPAPGGLLPRRCCSSGNLLPASRRRCRRSDPASGCHVVAGMGPLVCDAGLQPGTMVVLGLGRRSSSLRRHGARRGTVVALRPAALVDLMPLPTLDQWWSPRGVVGCGGCGGGRLPSFCRDVLNLRGVNPASTLSTPATAASLDTVPLQEVSLWSYSTYRPLLCVSR